MLKIQNQIIYKNSKIQKSKLLKIGLFLKVKLRNLKIQILFLKKAKLEN